MSSLFLFLTVVQALVTILLVVVILIQKSEGGGLGVGSSHDGFMSARCCRFVTRMTGAGRPVRGALDHSGCAGGEERLGPGGCGRSTVPFPPRRLKPADPLCKDGAGRQSLGSCRAVACRPAGRSSAKSKSLSMIAPPLTVAFGGEAALVADVVLHRVG
jgi:protein translocase SecG subunit